MSNLPIFDVAGSAMQAQSVRLSTVASNLANANTVAGTAEGAYRAKQPVFSAEPVAADPALAGVQVLEVRESDAAPIRVMVVDDHTLFRRGLKALLGADCLA